MMRERDHARKASAATGIRRMMLGRNRGQMAHALTKWFVACAEAEAANQVYTVEERARQQLMMQARTFQAKLEALEYIS